MGCEERALGLGEPPLRHDPMERVEPSRPQKSLASAAWRARRPLTARLATIAKRSSKAN
jgi:hypothetical protein